jgi:hypothetical protein
VVAEPAAWILIVLTQLLEQPTLVVEEEAQVLVAQVAQELLLLVI